MTDNRNLILLAVLGAGAFWLFSRPTMGQPYAARPGTQPNTTAQNVNAGANLVNALGRVVSGVSGWFGAGSNAPSTGAARIPNDDTAGQPGYGWQYFTNGTAISPTGTYYHNGQAVWSPDGAVVNPPGNTSPFDYANDPEYLAQVGL